MGIFILTVMVDQAETSYRVVAQLAESALWERVVAGSSPVYPIRRIHERKRQVTEYYCWNRRSHIYWICFDYISSKK